MDTEVCFRCDCPTGNAGKGDDSLYAPNGAGPYCHACFELVFELANLRAENERLSASESNWHHVADLRAIEIDRLRAEIERFKTRAMERAIEANERDARIAELEADVVWCVENPYRLLDTSGMWDDVPGNAPNTVLLLKVREARNGVS